MRGEDKLQADMFSYLSPETRVRRDHPLRRIRTMADEALKKMSPLFDALYATTGRPSIPPEKLLRAQLVQMLYSVRSERLLMEEIDYSVLFRWFVGFNMDDEVWDVTVFTKNRDRLLDGDVRAAVLVAGREPSARPGPDVRRAFHGGWHAGGSMGGAEEFPAEGPPAGASTR